MEQISLSILHTHTVSWWWLRALIGSLRSRYVKLKIINDELWRSIRQRADHRPSPSLARATRHTHGHSTLSSSTSFSFLFFLLVGFFLVLWFFLLPLLFFREPQATISYHARAHRVLFYFFWFYFFDFIASPLVRTGHHSRGSQQQHALTFIQMDTIRYRPAFHLFYLWCYDDDQARKEPQKKY